jgi:hypothetical protein
MLQVPFVQESYLEASKALHEDACCIGRERRHPPMQACPRDEGGLVEYEVGGLD